MIYRNVDKICPYFPKLKLNSKPLLAGLGVGGLGLRGGGGGGASATMKRTHTVFDLITAPALITPPP